MNSNFNLNNSENNILNHKEYIIKNENIDYNLRLEVTQQFVNFILSELNGPLEYKYINKMDLFTIVNKLELNVSKYSNLDLILKIMDNLNKKNKILININDDKSCTLNITTN